MNDQELMRALFSEGLAPAEIAEKFETTSAHVRQVLGIPGNPRQVHTYQRFWRLMGDAVLTSCEVAARLDQTTGYVNSYFLTLEERGHIRRQGKRGILVLWQMVRIEEWLPVAVSEVAA